MTAATLDTEALLVHGPFLRRLARSLLGDEHAAEDVVQQTWLATLRHPPRDAGKLRVYLASVARNLAREGGRREGRRRDWEAQAAQPEALPSTEEIVQREAVRRQVVQALLELDPLYRDVLLLRFYESLAPRHIAERLDLPVETVRTRIKRGLARMSSALDAEHGGDRRPWAAALVPLAFPTVARAGVAAALGAGLSSLGPAAQFVLVAVGTAVLAGAAWWLTRDAVDTPQQPQELARADDSGARGTGPTADEVFAADELLIERDPSPVPAPPEPGPTQSLVAAAPPLIEGRVLDGDGGAALPGARVVLAGVAFDDIQLLSSATRAQLDERWQQRTLVADASGRFRVGGLERGVWLVATAATAQRPFSASGVVLVDVPTLLAAAADEMVRRRCERSGLQPPRLHHLAADGVLALDVSSPTVPGHDVRVLGPDGERLPGATVMAVSPVARLAMESAPYSDWTWRRLEPALHEAEGDEQGLVPGVTAQPGGLLLASAPGHQTLVLELSADEPLPAPLELTLPPAVTTTVSGTVTDTRGRALPGVDVCLSDFGLFGVDHDVLMAWVERNQLVTTTSDEFGRFEFTDVDHLSRSRWDPTPLVDGQSVRVMAGSAGHLSAEAHLAVSPRTPRHEVRLELVPGGPLELTLIDSATLRPAEGATVHHTHGKNTTGLTLDEDGYARFPSRPHGDLSFTVRHIGHELQTLEVPDWRGGPIEQLVAFEPVPWSLSVGLTDPAGRPLGWQVPLAVGGDDGATISVSATDRDPSGLWVGGAGTWGSLSTEGVSLRWVDGRALLAFDRRYTADEAWIVVTCQGRLLAQGHAPRGLDTLELRAGGRWMAGTAAPLTVTLAGDEGTIDVFGPSAAVYDSADGTHVSNLDWRMTPGHMRGVVPGPGTYDLVITKAGEASMVVQGVEVDGPTELHLEPADPAVLEYEFTAGAKPARGEVSLFHPSGRCIGRGSASSLGRRKITVPWPASEPYLLVARSDAGFDRIPVTLTPGATQAVRLSARPGAALWLRAEQLSAGPVRLEIHDAEGRELIGENLDPEDQAALRAGELTRTLPAGRWDVTLFDLDQGPRRRTVELGAGGEVQLEL